jgi:hypothetical protein
MIYQKIKTKTVAFTLLLLLLMASSASTDPIISDWKVSDSFRYVTTLAVDLHEKSYPDMLCDAYDQIGEVIRYVEERIDAGASTLSMTTGHREAITEALNASLAPWLVTEEVIDRAIIISVTRTTDIWRVERPETVSYLMLLSFKVDDVRMMLVVSPEAGLVEASVLVDYEDLDSFEQAAVYYFNLPGYEAEGDYRPVNTFPTSGGWFRPDPECDYDHSGYIINLNEPERDGFVRSVNRICFTPLTSTGDEGEFKSIEFSLKYTVGE